ncbi:MAG: exodeoxyribonuclease VII large subunit [Streptococcus parasanguinis]
MDVLIIGRGGSIEDLWAFNEEAVVRAILNCGFRLSLVSDMRQIRLLADFVADRRAATPTAAAELATPVTKLDLLSHLQKQENRMATAMSNRLAYNRERLAKLSQSVIFRQPEETL